MAGIPSNEQAIYQHLAGEGWPLPDIAGIMANMEAESGFNPAASNAREGAVGLDQWEGGRKSQLDALAAARHTSETDLGTQLAFLDQELAGPYAAVATNLRSTTDAATAARYFDVGPGGANSGTGYENSSGSTTGIRESFAQTIFGQLSAGQIPSGGGSVTDANYTVQDAKHGTWLNPLNWPANLYDDTVGAAGRAAGGAVTSGAKSAAGDVLKVVLPFATKALFVVGGLGLVTIGVYKLSAPATRDKIEQVAPAAAALA